MLITSERIQSCEEVAKQFEPRFCSFDNWAHFRGRRREERRGGMGGEGNGSALRRGWVRPKMVTWH